MRSSHETCDPRPGRTPNAHTSNTPPRLSFALRARSISATIAALASSSRQRTGDSSTCSKSSGPAISRGGAFTDADLHDMAVDGNAERAQERLREAARRHARRGLPRAGALEDVAHVGVPELEHARRGRRGPDAAGGPPRSPRPPATDSSARPSSRGRGSRPAARRGCPACGRGGCRPRPVRGRTRSSSARRGRARAGAAPGRGRCRRE